MLIVKCVMVKDIFESNMEPHITVKKLKEILKYMKDDSVLYPNLIGNLLVTFNNESIGFINLYPGNWEFKKFDNSNEKK